MKRKSIYKVKIYNADYTTIFFLADNKLDAIHLYEKYMEEKYSKDFMDENQDFDVEFVDFAYYV